jgi:hypothetical protein
MGVSASTQNLADIENVVANSSPCNGLTENTPRAGGEFVVTATEATDEDAALAESDVTASHAREKVNVAPAERTFGPSDK